MAKQENHPQNSYVTFLWPSRPLIPEWAEEGIFQSPCKTIYKELELGKKKKKHSKHKESELKMTH